MTRLQKQYQQVLDGWHVDAVSMHELEFDASYSTPSTPYFAVTEGRGGGSMEDGWQGGIIKAFRIG